MALLLIGCSSIDLATNETDAPTAELAFERFQLEPSPTPIPINPTTTSTLVTAGVSPTASAPRLKPSATPPPTPHPMLDYSILNMRERRYPGSQINERIKWLETDTFTRYYIDYQSDGLTITGVMQVPVEGTPPYPVIILNHGYWPRRDYQAGTDTWEAANYLSSRGFITISPDYRSWGESDVGPSFFHTGLVADALNLVSSLASLDIADASRVGMWGHSMGGGITTKALTIDPRIRAAVLYAPNSSNDAELIDEFGAGCYLGRPRQRGVKCNRGEVIPPDIPQTTFNAYQEATQSAEILSQTSPINFFSLVSAPVQIHIGTQDDVTPPEWAEAIYQGLLSSGKSVEFFPYEGQGHFFEGQDWELFMERTAEFFMAQLGI